MRQSNTPFNLLVPQRRVEVENAKASSSNDAPALWAALSSIEQGLIKPTPPVNS